MSLIHFCNLKKKELIMSQTSRMFKLSIYVEIQVIGSKLRVFTDYASQMKATLIFIYTYYS